jgi:hypothetical protein
VRYGLSEIAAWSFLSFVLLITFYLHVTLKVIQNSCSEVTRGIDRVLGTEELNTCLGKYGWSWILIWRFWLAGQFLSLSSLILFNLSKKIQS